MKKCGMLIGKMICLWGILLGICISGLLFCSVLPDAGIRKHVEESIPLLKREGLYPNIFGVKLLQLDNYSDTIMLYECVTIDSKNPYSSIFKNSIFKSNDFFEIVENMEKFLQNRRTGLTEFEYSRYWHGYLLILRPLLLVFNYGEIRIINYIVLIILLTCVLRKIYLLIDKSTMWLFLFVQIMIAFPVIPLSMQFSWTFYIMYISILIMFYTYERKKKSDLSCFFFLVGGVTSFIDLLTTPILTLGMPLVISLLADKERSKEIERIYRCSVCWGIGYAFVWGSKWIISSLVTDKNVIVDATSQMYIRTMGSTWKGMSLTLINIAGYLTDWLKDHRLLVPVCIFALMGFVLYCLFLENRRKLKEEMYLLLIASMPIVWFIILREHSVQHGWFTWRGGMVTMFCLLLFIRNTCNLGKLKSILGQLKQI